MEDKYKSYLDAIEELIKAVEDCLEETNSATLEHMEKMLERVKIEKLLIK